MLLSAKLKTTTTLSQGLEHVLYQNSSYLETRTYFRDVIVFVESDYISYISTNNFDMKSKLLVNNLILKWILVI